jgi:CxxC motif-containing protein (DUF1111 family)
MKGPYWGWYLLIGIVALAPAGIRLMTWPGFRRQALDPQMVQAGQTLFEHKWTPKDPLAGGDGLGPVCNADSCLACHNQGGPGGGGDLSHNVTTFAFRDEASAALRGLPREGVIHALANVNVCPAETLKLLDPELPDTSLPTLAEVNRQSASRNGNHCISFVRPTVRVSQRNTPALFGANLIDGIPDRIIIANEKEQRLRWGFAPTQSEDLPVGRALRLADGRIGHFGWKAQSASLSDFVQAACANELGLGNPGQAQPKPLSVVSYKTTGYDLTLEQCDQISSFVASLPRPIEKMPEDSSLHSDAVEGKRIFNEIGCADCHKPDVGSVKGLYSDLLLHDMGQPLEGGGSYNDPLPAPDPNKPPSDPNAPKPSEWRTPPLWGVASSAPYLHDGRAQTLEQAIEQHGGQGKRSAKSFLELSPTKRNQVITFLRTLSAP